MERKIVYRGRGGELREEYLDLGPGAGVMRARRGDHKVPKTRTADGGFRPVKSEADR